MKSIKMTRSEFLFSTGIVVSGAMSLNSGCSSNNDGKVIQQLELEAKVSSMKSQATTFEKGSLLLAPFEGIVSSVMGASPVLTNASFGRNEEARIVWNRKANKVTIQVRVQNVYDLPRLKNLSSPSRKSTTLSFPTFHKTTHPVYRLWLITRNSVGNAEVHYGAKNLDLLEDQKPKNRKNVRSILLPSYYMIPSPIYKPNGKGKLVVNWQMDYNNVSQNGYEFVYGPQSLDARKRDIRCIVRAQSKNERTSLSFEHFLRESGFALDMSFKPYPKPVPPLVYQSGQPGVLG